MLLNNKKVAIIGAGPVGLTMAALLQQKVADVTVYERDTDPQARIWGGTLDLHEGTGQVALIQAGLLERYFSIAKPMGRIITDEQCNVLFSVPPQYDTPEINRNDLRKMLIDSLASDTVAWNRKFTGLEEQRGKWLLHFENQPDEIADLVIGANGAMSNARKYVTDTVVEYTGTIVIQGEVWQPELNCREFYNLCNHNIFMTAGKGINFVANPDNNGALTYGITFRKPEEWSEENGVDFQNAERVRSFLIDRFAHWNERYKELVRVTSSFWGLPTRKLQIDKPWKSERPLPITLIGDAAHVMPPFAGQGVNIGMVDALNLSDNLTNGKFETIEAAISDYEQKMFDYAQGAQLETSKNEIEMHDPGFSFKKRFGN